MKTEQEITAAAALLMKDAMVFMELVGRRYGKARRSDDILPALGLG